jgi:long-chain acyl-CoA synthetase
VGVIILESDQILLVKRGPQVFKPGLWCIPCGNLEWGEEVRAVVVRNNPEISETKLIEYCGERLASFKRPTSVVFVDELPRNVMGKVVKRDLREELGLPS